MFGTALSVKRDQRPGDFDPWPLWVGPEETLRDLFHDDKNRDSWKSWLRRFLPDLDSRIDFGTYQAQTLVVDARVCIGNWCAKNYARRHESNCVLLCAIG